MAEEAKKLVPKKFHKWIKVFGKKTSERMLIRKAWNHTIDMKEGFVPRKKNIVTTIYPMINNSTINKSQVRISCGNFTRELNKEPLLD